MGRVLFRLLWDPAPGELWKMIEAVTFKEHMGDIPSVELVCMALRIQPLLQYQIDCRLKEIILIEVTVEC